MPKQSKNSKNQKKVDNEPDPKPITSKFFVQDDEDDEQIEEQPIEPEENTKQIEPAIVQQKPIKSKFFVEEDDEEDIQTEPTPVQPIENTPITSKFFSNNDENEEAPKISKKSKKKGKKVDETPKIEEKKTEEIIIKDSSISKPNSKFFQAEEDEEEEPVQLIKEDLPEEKDEKKDKKKEKRKAKKEAQKEKKDEPKKEIVDKKPKKLTGAAKQALELMNKLKEEEDRIKKEEEERQRIEEEIRLKEEEEERVRKELDEKKKMDKKNKIMQGKIDGTYMTKKQREKMNEDLIKRKQLEEMGFLNTFDKTEEEKKSEPKKKFFKKKTELQELEEKLRLKELEKNQTSSINPNEKIQNSDETQIVEDWSQLISDNKETLASVNNPLTSPSKKPKDSQKNPDPSSQEEYKLAETQIQPKPQPQTQLKKETNPNPISKNPKNLQELRSPICCILGHVDTGKTTILDRIRNTNVQEGEAGGITQQIGATFFPASKLEEEIKKLKSFYEIDCNVPGILIIDTPGHESFSNLRSRGSSLCDIAILVIDLMHGIEKQTLESLELLKMRKTPFIVALNKIDRIYEWKPYKNESGYLSLKKQKSSSSGEFKKRLDGVITELAANGFNSALFWENPDVGSYISLVPTSGITGEGLPDLLGVILKYSSKFLRQKIKMLGDVFDCTVLEVKMIEGLGTTIDVILVNGELSEGDKIVLMGFNGPIVTTIRALLTPHPMKEMRVKNEYMHHKVNF